MRRPHGSVWVPTAVAIGWSLFTALNVARGMLFDGDAGSNDARLIVIQVVLGLLLTCAYVVMAVRARREKSRHGRTPPADSTT
jgi:hypothetical protein